MYAKSGISKRRIDRHAMIFHRRLVTNGYSYLHESPDGHGRNFSGCQSAWHVTTHYDENQKLLGRRRQHVPFAVVAGAEDIFNFRVESRSGFWTINLHRVANTATVVHQNLGPVTLHVEVSHVTREVNNESRVFSWIIQFSEDLNNVYIFEKSVYRRPVLKSTFYQNCVRIRVPKKKKKTHRLVNRKQLPEILLCLW